MELYLGPVKLNISSGQSIKFNLLPSKKYTKQLVAPVLNFQCHYERGNLTNAHHDIKDYFAGKSTDLSLMPYNWYVKKDQNNISIFIEFINDNQLRFVSVTIHPKENEILVKLHAKTSNTLNLDPLFQPLGSLQMVYLSHLSNAFLIHASGVVCNENGAIYTAVSGTGKSTMAGLWKQAGATVINDDRLWIQKIDGRWQMFNTPMIWYSQEPMMAPVNKVFLIRQSPVNEIKPLSGLNTSMKLMANCIQHLYDKEMTKAHLDRVLDFTSQVPVYDCGFKPDGEIVGMIRKMGFTT